MSMRFLHIKRAHVVDKALAYQVEKDIASNMTLLEQIYAGCMHDICAITEGGEWLMHGRKIDPTTLLMLYPTTFIYIHSPNTAYDAATLLCKAHAQQYVSIYHAIDAVAHHTERFASLVKTHAMRVKIPHEVYVDMRAYNENFTTSEAIAAEHIRRVFLPVRIVPSLYRDYVSHMHDDTLAHNHAELSQHIEALRHTHDHITMREHIQGEYVYVVSIPHFRNEDMYITMPITVKQIEGLTHFQITQVGKKEKKEIDQVVKQVSTVLFENKSVIYKVRIHGKRGVFIEGTSPAYYFIIHHHDALFALASSHGIAVRELFERLIAS